MACFSFFEIERRCILWYHCFDFLTNDTWRIRLSQLLSDEHGQCRLLQLTGGVATDYPEPKILFMNNLAKKEAWARDSVQEAYLKARRLTKLKLTWRSPGKAKYNIMNENTCMKVWVERMSVEDKKIRRNPLSVRYEIGAYRLTILIFPHSAVEYRLILNISVLEVSPFSRRAHQPISRNWLWEFSTGQYTPPNIIGVFSQVGFSTEYQSYPESSCSVLHEVSSSGFTSENLKQYKCHSRHRRR